MYSFVLEISQDCTQPETASVLKKKPRTKQDDGDVFWWIFGHVSLLKLEKYIEDDYR